MYEPVGIIALPGTIYELHRKGWKPPEYVTEFWQTGCKVRYTTHENYLVQTREVLESYDNFLKRKGRGEPPADLQG